jgi:tRNA threonylcarbamoyladenosine biosynthesis protein TsaB
MILCIETATSVCSVALTEGERIVSSREINEGFSHAEKLTVFISEVLEEAGVQVKVLDAIAVSSGPGSYTGLRIGISVVKGLCLSSDKPLISISTLEAMAYGANEKIKKDSNDYLLCPLIDARRMEVYCALYDSAMNCLHPSSAVVVDEAFLSGMTGDKPVYYFGDGAEKCKPVLGSNFVYLPGFFPSSKYMAALAENKLRNREFENLALIEPLYLKEYQAGARSNKK